MVFPFFCCGFTGPLHETIRRVFVVKLKIKFLPGLLGCGVKQRSSRNSRETFLNRSLDLF